MKKRFLSLLVLFICGNVLVSCNGCENKDNDPLPVQPPNASTSSSEVLDNASDDTDYNLEADQSTSSKGVSANESGAIKNNSATKNNSTTSGKKPARQINKITDYSAPNGTDAENHDGDPYTKHDTTAMPSGTSIR